MTRHSWLRAVALTLVAAAVGAQTATSPAGHWEGAIQIPGQELPIAIDLAGSGDKWEGTIDIPAQNMKAFPLSAITAQGSTVGFAIQGPPGDPTFKGTLSADGTSLSGDFTQGGKTIPFALKRTGDAKFEPLPKSTPVTKDLEGSWDGALDADGKALRLTLKLSNQPDGVATGMLISVDQGGAEIPATAVIQKGTHLEVVVRPIVGKFEGDLKEGQLIGTWTQGPRSLPLTFKRAM